VFFDPSENLWVAEITLGVGPDGKRRRKRVKSRDKAEVVRKLAVLRAAAAKGDDADRTSTEAWLTELAPARRSANTIANYRWAFEKWVIPNVGKIPLADLGPGDLERVWRLMEAKGHSANGMAPSCSAGPAPPRWPWQSTRLRASAAGPSSGCWRLRCSSSPPGITSPGCARRLSALRHGGIGVCAKKRTPLPPRRPPRISPRISPRMWPLLGMCSPALR